MSELTTEQIERISQLVAQNKFLGLISRDALRLVPLDCWIQRVAVGGNLNHCPTENLEKFPREFWDQYIAKGNDCLCCPWSYQQEIPQEIWFQYFANGGYRRPELKEIMKNVPPEIMEMTNKAKKALEQFKRSKITSKELPMDVFVNHDARRQLIDIVEQKTQEKFNKVCQKHHYIDEIPEEVKIAFDETLQKIYDDISKRMEDDVKGFTRTETELVVAEVKKFGEDW